MYQQFHKLRVRFAEMEMNQGEVADRAGISRSTMTSRMKGYHPWTSAEIIRVAAVLDIPKNELGAFFFEDGPKMNGVKE